MQKVNSPIPPVTIRSTGVHNNHVSIQSTTSSQFARACLAAVYAEGSFLELQIIVSTPYLDMTANIIESFGGTCDLSTIAGGIFLFGLRITKL